MTVFSVLHSTTYRYKKLVKPGRRPVLFRPRDSFDQRLLDSRLTVTPDPAEVRWIHDVFGNCMTLVDFTERTSVLKFESVIRLEHTSKTASGIGLRPHVDTCRRRAVTVAVFPTGGRRLTKGPTEFREDRVDLPKAKK
jgi:transglutaminase-like putative cysteine protease